MVLAAWFDFDILKVLGYGLSGFAFLLMFFAFLLLRQIINKEKNTPTMVIKSIWGFMGLSFVMTLLIGLFSFLVGDYKKEQLVTSKEIIDDQQNSIELVNENQRRDSLVHATLNPDGTVDQEKFKEVKEKQEAALDSMSNKIDNVQEQSHCSVFSLL